MTILEEIVAYKKKFVSKCEKRVSQKTLEHSIGFERFPLSLNEFLLDDEKTGIIAEFKRQSPSKGIINDKASVKDVTQAYANFGASALSVLSDENYFGGSNDDIVEARNNNSIPILRKDFIISEYQIIEAKAIGADAILLIASCLSKDEALELASLAKSIGLSVLMEIHEKSELEMLNEYIDVVGVNNRNLKTFETSINTSIELSQYIKDYHTIISESGIHSVEDIKLLQEHGYDGFLIGENFMKNDDPGNAFKEFTTQL